MKWFITISGTILTIVIVSFFIFTNLYEYKYEESGVVRINKLSQAVTFFSYKDGGWYEHEKDK